MIRILVNNCNFKSKSFHDFKLINGNKQIDSGNHLQQKEEKSNDLFYHSFHKSLFNSCENT